MNAKLRKGLESLGLESNDWRSECLETYIAEIELWNPSHKLIASGEDLVVRHILDSLVGLKIIQNLHPKHLADVGSGAGFPGIPLSLWLDETHIVLIERSERRAGFLQNIVRILGRKNIQIFEKPVEEVTHIEPFDVITCRAWLSFSKSILKILLPLLKKDGVIATYKGRWKETKAELQALESFCNVEITPLQVPGLNAQRCLGLIKPVMDLSDLL